MIITIGILNKEEFFLMYWLELTVKVHPEAVESVSELMSKYSTEGLVIEEPYELTDDGQDYRILRDQPVTMRGYLPIDGTEEEKRQQIEHGLWHLGFLFFLQYPLTDRGNEENLTPPSISSDVGNSNGTVPDLSTGAAIGARCVGEMQIRSVDEEDWANAWKEYYYVTHIGERLVIRPSWREYTPKENEVVLTLDPGMAFGTGIHPTTRLCLERVEQLVQAGMRVLDVGTGSGILALAAVKLGAESVYAIDNSSVAVESASANAGMNGLRERVQVVLGVLDEVEARRLAGVYNLVLANIIAHVIGSIAPQLAMVLADDGLLVVSGIIEARRPDAEGPLLATGLELVHEAKIDDWLALTYRKRV
jgi:ribosomal protein L11 methyltransferase